MKLLLSAVLCTFFITAYTAEDYVWVEGESMVKGTLHGKHDNVSQHKNLSGGVSFGNNKGKHEGEWNIEIPDAGEWNVYVRKFWKHGPFKWNFNADTPQSLTKADTVLLDSTGLDRMHQGINWVYLGTAKLKKGSNVLKIEGLEEGGAFVIDCFVLTKNKFEPSGLKKPGDKLGLTDAGRWNFEPDYDSFEVADALGLRALNEKSAGENGYIGKNDAGDFVDGKGNPIRFWAAQGSSLQAGPGIDALTSHAKHLAKRGVNMYRHHGHLNPDKNSDPMKTRPEQIDAIQKMVAVMGKEGIYSTVSPFWATHSEGSADWGIKGFRGGKLTGLVFWNEDFKAIYKKWWKDTLTQPNPYHPNKTPLAEDPALAIIQLQNEDSLLFWTFTRFAKDQPELYKQLEGKFNQWLKDNKLPATPFSLDFWQAVNNVTPERSRVIRYLTELMYEFNAEMADYLHKELKCKALINAGNWKTADATKLLDLERWSYTANEVVGVNRYVNGNGPKGESPHESPNGRSGYAVDAGDSYQDHSVLTFPHKLATNAKLVKGFPYIISESTWVSPMSYQSEGPFLVAAYSSLNGMDAYYWFALGSVGYDKGINKWQAANPAIMGTWPAASLMFRKGYIKQGEAAVHEERALEGDMWELRSPIIVEEAGFDANRDASVSPLSAVKSGVPALAYLVGPVEVVYGGDPANNKVVDFKNYIQGNKTTSITGELEFDSDTGLCKLDAPKVQGVTGFLKKAGGTIQLSDLSIKSENDYATVIAVSVDGLDLNKSKKVFLQITTKCRPYGWKESPTNIKGNPAFKIESVGQAPMNVWNTLMSVSLKNKNLKKVTLLDENLYPTSTAVTASSKGGSLEISLPENAMYLMLE